MNLAARTTLYPNPRTILPNPFEPSVLTPNAVPGLPEGYARNQTARRFKLLATTRQLLNEHQMPSITIRQLAIASGLSVQTLYNLVGGRETIIIEALKDFIDRIVYCLHKRENYPNLALAIADANFAYASLYPQLAIGSMQGFLGESRWLFAQIQRHVMNIYITNFEKLRSVNEIRHGADIQRLSNRLVLFTTTSAIDWRNNFRSPKSLREELIMGCAGLLLNCVSRGHAERVEEWLDAQRAIT